MAFYSRETFRLAAAVFVVAFIIRAGFILAHPRPLFSDEQEYHALASSITSNGSYSWNGVSTAYRPIGYPVVLSIVYTLSGKSVLAAKLVQAILDSIIACFLVYLAGPMPVSRRLAAGLSWALFPPAIFYTNLLLSETLSAFLLTAFAAIFLLKHESQAHWRFITAGIVVGMLLLVKPFLVVFVLLFLLMGRSFHLSRVDYVSFICSVLIITLPWAFRNLVAMHEFTLSTNSGLNLFIGNNPRSTGAYSSEFPAELTDSANSETVLEAKASRLAFEFMAQHPIQCFINGFRKMTHFFRGEGELAVLTFHPNPADRQSSFAEKYRSLPSFLPLVVTIPYMLVVLLVLMRLIAGESDSFVLLFLLLLLSLVIVHGLFFGGSRFHFILMPFAVLLASGQLLTLPSTLRSLHRMKTAAFLVLSAGFCTIWVYEFIYLAEH